MSRIFGARNIISIQVSDSSRIYSQPYLVFGSMASSVLAAPQEAEPATSDLCLKHEEAT